MNWEGFTIKPTIGIGDKVQFSSLPENYYRATGNRLVDVSKSWIFDFNPYVQRDVLLSPDRILELWNFGVEFRPKPRAHGVYLSNAEHHAALFGVPVTLNRPRLYCFESFPFEKRSKILLQTRGVSHGHMPPEIIDHVIKKYKSTGCLYQIGNKDEPDLGLPKIETPTLWDLARELSQARMLIGMDSGPSWIAACYPDVIIKKVRTKPSPEHFRTWVPLEVDNIHAHWDDRIFQIFNTSREDVGFTSSYLKI